MNPKVNILLATYNGSLYINDQIESILSQSYKNINLYIIDDCSSDNTIEIICRFSDKRIILIDNNKKYGYPGAFNYLLKNCSDADYYCYADQDDIWNRDKVERAVNMMEKYERSNPSLYFADYIICDSQLNPIRRSWTVPKPITFYNSLFQCYAYGFTVMFNQAQRKLLISSMDKVKHPQKDYWNQMIAIGMGRIIHDNYICANWRRHGETTSPSTVKKLSFMIWRYKHFLLEDKFKDYHDMLDDFYKIFYNDLSVENRLVAELFASKKHRLMKVFFPHRLRNSLSDEVLLRLAFLIGKL
ncbi:glycosyltransferase [Oscillospiraceae bacterium HV4-5-C5C]|nr:glycosyltransferase [Oscillospiraceae bacterium HV4-5-C5C]